MTGSTEAVHGLRPDAPAPAPGTSYADAVGEWEARASDCLVEVGDGTTARPLLLVAAEGGGIRAAYWTAAVLDTLAGTDCGLAGIAVASGVSGGAVGLAVSRVAAPGTATETVWRMGGPDALAQASIGLLVRDPIHTVTGVPPLVAEGWLDRAALMEASWERTAPALAGDFYAVAGGSLAAPLVLGSVDAASGCRVLVTHLEIAQGRDAAACTLSDAPLAYSRDVRDYMATAGHVGAAGDSCLAGLRTSTAAMLAARFPYVTPSAVVGPCGQTPRAQLVDGGYAEGSGLGALVDLAPELLHRLPAGPPVLPLVVYLDNGRGGDLLPIPPRALSEFLVPPVGALTASGTQNSTAAWLQRAQALNSPGTLRPRVFVVAQGSEPTVEAPLGWVLSAASRGDMDESLRRAVADCGAETTEDPTEAQNQRYANLPELLELLGAC